MHMAIENTSSACMRAILNVICHQSFVHTHADMHAILNTCRVMQLRYVCTVKFRLSCAVRYSSKVTSHSLANFVEYSTALLDRVSCTEALAACEVTSTRSKLECMI